MSVENSDKIFSYFLKTTGSVYGQNDELTKALSQGYKIIDVITNSIGDEGVAVTVVVTNSLNDQYHCVYGFKKAPA